MQTFDDWRLGDMGGWPTYAVCKGCSIVIRNRETIRLIRQEIYCTCCFRAFSCPTCRAISDVGVPMTATDAGMVQCGWCGQRWLPQFLHLPAFVEERVGASPRCGDIDGNI